MCVRVCVCVCVRVCVCVCELWSAVFGCFSSGVCVFVSAYVGVRGRVSSGLVVFGCIRQVYVFFVCVYVYVYVDVYVYVYVYVREYVNVGL